MATLQQVMNFVDSVIREPLVYNANSDLDEGLILNPMSPSSHVNKVAEFLKKLDMSQLHNQVFVEFDQCDGMVKDDLAKEQAVTMKPHEYHYQATCFIYMKKIELGAYLNLLKPRMIRQRCFESNKIIKQYRYEKRKKNTGGLTVYCNSGREFVSRIIGIDTDALIAIEELVEDVADDLYIMINGTQKKRGNSYEKNNTWCKKASRVKNVLYGVIKRILWDFFGYKLTIIELIVKRFAYIIAQNKRQLRDLIQKPKLSVAPNQRFRKNAVLEEVIKTNPKFIKAYHSEEIQKGALIKSDSIVDASDDTKFCAETLLQLHSDKRRALCQRHSVLSFVSSV